MTSDNVEISIQPARAARVLSAAALVLVLFGIAAIFIEFRLGYPTALGFIEKFGLDQEFNIPTFFSTLLLLLATLLLSIIAMVKRRQRAEYGRHWQLLALIFLYLTVDEAAFLHELWGNYVERFYKPKGPFYFAWVIPGAAFVGVCGFSYAGFLFHLPEKIRRLVFVAAAMYVGGALGLEFFEGYYYELYGESAILHLLSAAQETLEMSGMILFIYALLCCLGSMIKVMEIRFEREG